MSALRLDVVSVEMQVESIVADRMPIISLEWSPPQNGHGAEYLPLGSTSVRTTATRNRCSCPQAHRVAASGIKRRHLPQNFLTAVPALSLDSSPIPSG